MKLLLVTRSIPMHPATGGMETVSWDLATTLGSTMSVEVLTTAVPGRPRSFVEEGIQVTTIPNTRPGRYSPAWWIGTALFSRVHEFDAVLSVSGGATAMIHLQRGPRYIFQAHGTALGELKNAIRVRSRLWPLKALRYTYWTALDSITYRRVSKVVAASEQVAGFLRSWPYAGAWRKTELQVILNAVDSSLFSHTSSNRRQARDQFGFSETDTVAVTLARSGATQGIDRMIHAVGRGGNDVRLLVAGAGTEEGNFKGINDSRVSFIGNVDRDRLRDVMAAGDVFILPERVAGNDSLPLSVLEALASGLRVIVPNDSHWPEDLTPLLQFVDIADAEVLAQAVMANSRPATSSGHHLVGSYSLSDWDVE